MPACREGVVPEIPMRSGSARMIHPETSPRAPSMSATYRCAACRATWIEEDRPEDCPKCGSPDIEWAGSSTGNPYDAPEASISATSPVSGTSFTITYWLGWVGLVIGYGLFVAAIVQNAQNAQNAGAGGPGGAEPLIAAAVLLIFASFILLATAYIIGLVKLYRGWKAIQPLRRVDREEADMPTPGAAVGLLFVPFYNLYWVFVAFRGLAARANNYMARSGVRARPMNEGMALTYGILTVCTVIPGVGILAALANIVLHYMIILEVDRMRRAIQGSDKAGFKADRLDDFGPA